MLVSSQTMPLNGKAGEVSFWACVEYNETLWGLTSEY